MSTPQQRETLVKLIEEAVIAGSRRSTACQLVGINVRTLQRWYPKGQAEIQHDQYSGPQFLNKLPI